jgi:MarR family transcriptional regulator for hemolysin
VLDNDFQETLGHGLCKVAHLFERAMRDELDPQGITFRQCQVLAWLALEGEMSQVELADRMSIEPPTLVGVLDRMERDGLLTRKSDPHDRRRKIIAPSPKAEPVWKKIIACGDRVEARARRDLSPRQFEALKELLGIVERNLHRPHSKE